MIVCKSRGAALWAVWIAMESACGWASARALLTCFPGTITARRQLPWDFATAHTHTIGGVAQARSCTRPFGKGREAAIKVLLVERARRGFSVPQQTRPVLVQIEFRFVFFFCGSDDLKSKWDQLTFCSVYLKYFGQFLRFWCNLAIQGSRDGRFRAAPNELQ